MEQKARVSASNKKIYRQNVLAEWTRSGLSQAECCRQRKIAHSNFFVWRKRLKLKDTAIELPRPLFSSVTLKPETDKSSVSGSNLTPLTLVLKNQMR